MTVTSIIAEATTLVGLVAVFYLGGVVGFISYGIALPRIDEVTIKGLILGSLIWPVILVYDLGEKITEIIYS